MTVQQIYEQTVKPLSEEERLALADQILNDLGLSRPSNYSETWTDEDIEDMRLDCMRRAAELYEEGERDVQAR